MQRCRNHLLLLISGLVFAAAVCGSVYCGLQLTEPGLPAEEVERARVLIYFHFFLAQLSILGAALYFYLRHRRWRRYYLLISYNEKGMQLDPPGIRMPRERVYRCNLHSMDLSELPPADAPVLVYPMFMLSGISSGRKTEQFLQEAYARLGRSPQLFFQPVLGASPWLARAAAAHLKKRLSPAAGVLVVAHGSGLSEPPPEPALFCRRLRELLPGTEIVHGYFGQSPLAQDVMTAMQSRHVFVLPFLLTEGVHTLRDLPTPENAAAVGKTLERLPVVAALLSLNDC